jgi:hypothetical protein
MDITRRVLGPIALPRKTGDSRTEIRIDAETFLHRLLLFDTSILVSVRLKEIPLLVPYFGYEGIRDLLASGALKIRCECAQMGLGPSQGPRLPKMTYSFLYVDAQSHEDYVHTCLQNIHHCPGLKHKEILQLKRNVAEAIQRPYGESDSDKVRTRIIPGLESDLLHNKVLVEAALRTHFARMGQVSPQYFTFEVNKVGSDVFSVTTDLAERANISIAACDGAFGGAFLAVGELQQRLGEMQSYEALSGFDQEDLPLFQAKLGFLEALAGATHAEARFVRVMSIALPSLKLEPGTTIDIDKLLKIRSSSELREFRDWLVTTDSDTEGEIRARVAGIKAQLGVFAQSTTGKVIRFLVGAGTTLLSGAAGTIAGLGVSVVDQFLIDRVLPRTGIAAFVNELYPSLFGQ